MKKLTTLIVFILLLSTSLFSQIPQIGTEFGIATGSDSTFALAGAWDSEKYLVIMRRELSTGGAEIVGQFLSKADNSLIGNPIVLGTTNISVIDFDLGIPQVAFDGNRFLVVWTDGQNGGIKYRFIDATTFQLSNLYSDPTLPCYLTGVSILHYNPSLNKYFLPFLISSGNNYYLAGIFIRPDGFMENSFQLTSLPVRREITLAYGNSKYLVGFVKEIGDYDKEVWGQLISESGYPIGSSFLIDGSPEPSDNPLFLVFDGTKFICFFPDEESTGWKIYAKFVNLDGTVQNLRIFVTANAYLLPFATVNGNELLFTCTGLTVDNSIFPPIRTNVIGKFFDLSLNPKSNEFIVYDTLGGKNPMGNFAVYGGGKYLVFTTRGKFLFQPDYTIVFTDGDAYGVTISSITKVEDESTRPFEFSLEQNFPNPFNPVTKIKYSIPQESFVTIALYDLLGKEIRKLVNENKSPGNYEIEVDASGLPSGVYFYKMQAGNFIETRKMVLVK
jgi:hypothetical protein